jgi:tRNA (guanine37-N1)-methyltransferase
MQFDIITIFPHIFDSYLDESILRRAQKKKLIKIKIHDLRDYTQDKRKTVDDRPYGGGPGMLLKAEPIYKALQSLKSKSKIFNLKSKIILLDPAGKKFDQRMAKRLSKLNRLILICGRYEGFDERVKKFTDESVSIGDYVLSGGELPAMVIIEAISRQLPGVIGHEHALDEETFSQDKNYIEYPQYTRPEVFKTKNSKKLSVPKILLSGDHKKIGEWRKGNKKK